MGGVGTPHPFAVLAGRMDFDEDDLPEALQAIVFAAVDPEAYFRRTAARQMVREFYKKFGDQVLWDLLSAIDSIDKFASLVVLERAEVDNYLFEHHGVFDDSMFIKIQMTETWNEFMAETVRRSGLAASKAIEEVLESERDD